MPERSTVRSGSPTLGGVDADVHEDLGAIASLETDGVQGRGHQGDLAVDGRGELSRGRVNREPGAHVLAGEDWVWNVRDVQNGSRDGHCDLQGFVLVAFVEEGHVDAFQSSIPSWALMALL